VCQFSSASANIQKQVGFFAALLCRLNYPTASAAYWRQEALFDRSEPCLAAMAEVSPAF